MSTLLLSLLLILLVLLGLMMGPSLVERFQNPPEPITVQMSPALANLLATPALVATATATGNPQVDVLGRDKDIQDSQNKASWTQVPDSRNMMVWGESCAHVGTRHDKELDECMDDCTDTDSCNLMSYVKSERDCVMYDCADPSNPPMITGLQHSTSWYTSTPAPKPKPGPKPGPSPSSWTQVPDSRNTRAECPSVGNTVNVTLDQCMDKCDSTSDCNLINYDSSTTGCMMQNCSDPQKPKLRKGYDGTVWWKTSAKPGPKPSPKPDPKPSPKPDPKPEPSGCPDMSQYIRLDEVPCWNCTLP